MNSKTISVKGIEKGCIFFTKVRKSILGKVGIKNNFHRSGLTIIMIV